MIKIRKKRSNEEKNMLSILAIIAIVFGSSRDFACPQDVSRNCHAYFMRGTAAFSPASYQSNDYRNVDCFSSYETTSWHNSEGYHRV